MLEEYKVNIADNADSIINRVNKEKIYIEFVESQQQGFMRFINYINFVVDTLKKKARISPFIEIRARIKDINSALKNYNEERMLDDVFGVEIICANEDEKIVIKNELERYFRTTRTKNHNKPNGYKAEHESYSIKKNVETDEWNLQANDVPVVECQFKTIEVELNPTASHHDYKVVNKEEIQKLLKTKTLKIGKEIPRMWVSRENGMIELSYKEIIQRIYPFVDVTKIKEVEKEENIK